MASAWGAWVHTDDWRCGVNAWVVSETSTTATIRVQNIFENVYLIGSRSGNSVRCSCDGATRSADMSLGTNYGHTGQKVIKTEDFTVAKKDSARNVSCGATIVVGSGSAGTSSASVSVRIGAISYSKPADPSSCAAVREGDSKASVTWSNGATTALAPRTATLVDRSTDGGDFAQIASVGKDAANYTDNGIEANHSYTYRVRAQGNGGYSNYSTSESIYTTPAAPLSVDVSKVQATTVRIAADVSNVNTATAYDIEVSKDGGVWELVSTVEDFPATADVSGRAKFRVRSTRGELQSAWTESDEITTIVPPLAPKVSGLPSVAATGSSQTVAWVPNHPDGTAQSAAQVEFTKGGSTQTVDVTDAKSCTVPSSLMASPSTVSVRVRTKGLDPSWGAWSPPVAMAVAVPPSAAITNPPSDGTVIDALPLTVAWTVSDATGVSEQVLALKDSGGNTLWSATVPSDARSFQMPYRVDNLERYSLSLMVRGGSSLAVTVTRTFETDYKEPASPTADVEVDRGGLSVEVTVHEGHEDGAPPTASFDVARVLADGARWTVASGLTDSQVCVDPLPPLNVDFSYEVVATSDMDTQSVLAVPFRIRSGEAAFNFGQSAGACETFAYDQEWSHSVSRSTALYDFADGGEAGGLPVAYTSTTVSSTRRQGMRCVDVDQLRRVQALAASHGVCWFRDLYGGRARCAFSFDMSAGVPYDLLKISATMTEVRFREAW